MAQAGVIRDFLVALGFQTDNSGLGQMKSAMEGVELKAKALNGALLALATGAVIAVRQTASELDKLHFASQRIGASVTNINAYGNAIAQLGGSAEGAVGSLESLADKMRNSPGYESQIKSLGVSTRDANGQMRDRVEVMKDLSGVLSKMPAYQANAYANSLGIDQNTLLAMRDGKFMASMEKYQRIQKELGMNDDLAKSGNEFMTEYRDLTMMTKTGFQVIVMQAGKALIPILRLLNQMIQAGIHAFSQLNPQIKEGLAIGLRFALVAVVLGGFIKTFGMIFKFVPMLKGFIGLLKLFRLAFLASPIGIILALASALYLLYDDYKTWRDGGKSLFDWSKWTNGIDKIISKIKDFLAMLEKVKDKVVNFVQKIISDPVGAVQEVVETAKDVAKQAIKKAEEKAPEIVQGGINLVKKGKEAAINAITPKGTGTLYYGDSIAEGYKTANKGEGNTKVGANPRYIADEISKAIQANKDIFKGKDVILSSGYSNDNQDLKNVAKQLKMLKDAGANVQLLGVAKNFKGDKTLGSKMNVNLEALAKKMGAKFNGGFDASNDNVHPKTYKKSFAEVAASGAKALQGMVQGAVAQSQSGKYSFSFGKDVDKYIKEASVKYGIDEKILRGFVKMEAGWTGKMSPTGAIGTGQFVQNTWNGLAKTQDGKDIGMTKINKSNFRKTNDPRHNKHINTLATGLLAKQNADILKKYGIPITGENLYLAHNIGAVTFAKAFTGKGANSAGLLAMRQNGMKKGETPKQFVKRQRAIYMKHYNIANKENPTTPSTTPKNPKDLAKFAQHADLPSSNPHKSQVNNSSNVTASNVTIHQSFKTDMTLNGVSSPIDAANAVKRQQENQLAFMARSAMSPLAG